MSREAVMGMKEEREGSAWHRRAGGQWATEKGQEEMVGSWQQKGGTERQGDREEEPGI